MNFISNASIKIKLIYIVAIAMVNVFAIIATNKFVTDSIKIGSPTYTKIVNSKDLLADILPPPAYIIEARLITLELLQTDDSTKTKMLIDKLAQLQKDINDRKTYWDENLNNDELMNLLKPSYESGVEYFKVINEKYIPLINQRDIASATILANGELEKIYATHRTYIDKLVTASIDESTNIEKSANDNLDFGNNILIIGTLISLFLIIIVSVLVGKNIINSIDFVKNGLSEFFTFLNRKTNQTPKINLASKDEFGQMATLINENIASIGKSIKEDDEFVLEISRFANEMISGNMLVKIEKDSSTPNLIELKKILTNLQYSLEHTVARNLNMLISVLNSFKNEDFTDRFPAAYAKVAVSINELGDVVSKLLTESLQNGLMMNNSANMLLSNVDILSRASNTAAASLEETAAALEQITSNISQNTNTVVQMSNFANALTSSALTGQNLASQTSVAMDEINIQVNAINEAISVIDQIAFQTNILSLNAAVEAATAGEAGKGFAVVAQEVRNLASRSSEAAQEIKYLVENAKNKANQGKAIADEMTIGYDALNQNISKTLDLIKDVEMASKEQLSGIVQINNAVSLLDQQTQENASVANQTREIALQTQSVAQEIVNKANTQKFTGKEQIAI
ncbi:MAG: methyl-accepting chemotaxis protein [Arcobacteraceae bacterium]|nr:methyl-accepting chemotaxis protein [Arcobacteraceae bacterium]